MGIASAKIAEFFVEDIRLGFYSEKLKPWIDVFGPSRIHIVDGSNLVKNPDVEYQKIMEFINDAVFIACVRHVRNNVGLFRGSFYTNLLLLQQCFSKNCLKC